MSTAGRDGASPGHVDLLVIGAGINGAGIARDAALRGLSVLLADKGDIGGGTTSWSTRLIHGGLRYLEHYEVPLVRESLRERERLLRIAPHLVRPLSFLIPVYAGDRRGPLLIRLGMVAYDILSRDKSLPRHRMLRREQTLRRLPSLNPDGLKGAAWYYDAQVAYPERLALENALSARAAGAEVLTHTRVERLLVEGDTVVGGELRDLLDGGRRTVRAALTINAGGPWVDEVVAGLDPARRPDRMIGGTKGTHVVVAPFPGAPSEALYVEAREDHRPYFILPWQGQYLIGTTDTRYDGDLDQVVAEDDEIDYLLKETNRVIPGASLGREDVLYTYAGVRPLPYQAEGSEGAITRSHIIRNHEPELRNLLSVIGGKLTTYRNLAEQAVDETFERLGRKSPKCRTAELNLPGASAGSFEDFAAGFRAARGLDDATAERLLRIYGTRVDDVLALAGPAPDLAGPLGAEPGSPLKAEVVFALRHELARTLTDVLMRRTMAGLQPGIGLDVAEEAAAVAARHAGWDEDRTGRELDDYRAYAARFRPRAEAHEPVGGAA